MVKKFNEQSVLVKVILLIIPFVGWVVELILRWESFLNAPAEKKTLKLVVALLFTFLGWAWIWQVIDVVWVILYGHITFAEA